MAVMPFIHAFKGNLLIRNIQIHICHIYEKICSFEEKGFVYCTVLKTKCFD